ncbi:MAG: hypothetical protein HYU28_07590 [Actinobacteria bacterium]|nr:hypothetical protein [Actinomycetota bacterium]
MPADAHARSGISLKAALLASAVAFLAGLAAPSLVGSGSDPVAPRERVGVRSTGPTAEPHPGPTTTRAGMPAGFAPTEAGAVAAAASYVTTGQALIDMDPMSVEDAIRQMSAEDSAEAQVDDLVGQLRTVRETLAPGTGPIVYRQAVVAYRVEAWSPERARVAVWNVGVLTRTGVAPPQAGWAISTFDLVWERDDWRIWAETIVPGPAPTLDASTAPATAEQFTASLEGFTDFGAPR